MDDLKHAQKGSISIDADAPLDEKSQEIMKKLDKESDTRSFESPLMKNGFYFLATGVSLYHHYTAVFGPPVTLKHRSLYVALMLVLAFLMYPFCKKCYRKKV